MSKFHIGDLVIGNELASEEYCTTIEGFVGEVTEVYDDNCIEIKASWGETFTVEESYFELYESKEEREKKKGNTPKDVVEFDYNLLPQQGDLVRIMSFEEILQKYNNKYFHLATKNEGRYNAHSVTDGYYPIIAKEYTDRILFSQNNIYYKKEMDCFANMHAVISKKRGDGYVSANFLDNERIEDFEKSGKSLPYNYSLCEEMFEVVEKDYVAKVDAEEAKRIEHQIEQSKDDEIIKEMISKVDKKNVKRILSASLKLDAKEIVGVDKLLMQWAIAKKDLYLLLDNNLKVTFETEIEKNKTEKENTLFEIRKKFPRRILLHKKLHTYQFDI